MSLGTGPKERAGGGAGGASWEGGGGRGGALAASAAKAAAFMEASSKVLTLPSIPDTCPDSFLKASGSTGGIGADREAGGTGGEGTMWAKRQAPAAAAQAVAAARTSAVDVFIPTSSIPNGSEWICVRKDKKRTGRAGLPGAAQTPEGKQMLEWLEREFETAVGRVRPSHLEWMRARGVEESSLAAAGGFGVARARIDGGLWEPDDDGVPVVVLPARSPSGFDGAAGILYDLAAFRPDDPKTILRRRGDAVWLGEDELELCAFWHLPPTLRADPMDWLRAGAKGIVSLDWKEASERLLDFSGIECADEALAGRVRRTLSDLLMRRMPMVRVRADKPPAPAKTEAIELHT